MTSGEIGESLRPAKFVRNDVHYWSQYPHKNKASSPSLSVSSARNDKELLLPLVIVTVSKNGHILNCLLDSGSLSDEVAKELGIKFDSLPAL